MGVSLDVADEDISDRRGVEDVVDAPRDERTELLVRTTDSDSVASFVGDAAEASVVSRHAGDYLRVDAHETFVADLQAHDAVEAVFLEANYEFAAQGN